MWFLNKNTNIEWYIIDKEHQTRLLENDDYIMVEKEIDIMESNEAIKIIDLESLKLKELQDLAKEKEIKFSGLKKDELIELLKEVI